MKREDALHILVNHSKRWSDVDVTGWLYDGGRYLHNIHDPITIDDWNRAKIVNGVFVRTNIDGFSEYVESIWHGSKATKFEICFGGDGGSIHFPSYDQRNKEIFIEMPKENPQNELKQEIIDSAPEGAERYSEEFEVYFKLEGDDYFFTCGKIREWEKVDGFGLKTIEKDFMGATPLPSKHTSEASSEINAKVLAEKVNASDVLSQGAKHLSDRAVTYDSPDGERSMSATVEAFESITGHPLTQEQGWLFMAILKAVRSQQGEYKLDNYEDGAAYFALMAEAASEARK